MTQARSPTGSLRIVAPEGWQRDFPVLKESLRVGRQEDNDLVIQHASISRHHAILRISGGGLSVEDLGSSNGTYIDNLRILPHQPAQVVPGQRLRLGQVELYQNIQKRGRSFQTPAQVFAAGAAAIFIITLCIIGLVIAGRVRAGQKAALFSCDQPSMIVLAKAGQRLATQENPPTQPPLPTDVPSQTPAEASQPATRLPEPSETSPAVPTIQTQPAETASLVELTPTGTNLAPVPVETIPPSRPIESLAFLDLPFPYDGGNVNFGGTIEQFKKTSQRSRSGGRINSFFDHYLPLYPPSKDPNIPGGKEPADPPIGKHVLTFYGENSPNASYSGHPAYDFSTFEHAKINTPLLAAADGIVAVVGEHKASGALFVKINHSVPGVGVFQTVYWHLHPDEYFEAMKNRVGQFITAGTRVGTMGNTGWSTGPHLHFEVRFDRNGDGFFSGGEAVDPYGFIPSADYAQDPWYDQSKLVSNYLWIHPLSVTAQVPEDSGGQLDQPGGIGGIGLGDEPDQGSRLCAPKGALPAGGTVIWSWSPDPEPSDSATGVGSGCTLSVFDASGNPLDKLSAPLRVILPFTGADLNDIDPKSLAIYWQEPGKQAWQALKTSLDLERRLASALVTNTGHCALLGKPTRDLVAPRTQIELNGLSAPDGSFYDHVSVSLHSSDPSGIARLEYSLDAGTTWQSYSGPFILEPSGIPDPSVIMDEEFFAGGPGRYLILASALDKAGNQEYPPAWRQVAIDPSKNPDYAPTEHPLVTPTPTPSPSPSPTLTPAPSMTLSPTQFTCTFTALVEKNAFCRQGPSQVYDPVTAFTPGIAASIAGRNRDSTWWWITIPGSSAHCWISEVTVKVEPDLDTSCLPVIKPPPTKTPTFTPHPSKTSTPTISPSVTNRVPIGTVQVTSPPIGYAADP